MTSLTEKLLKIPKTHKYKMQPCFFYVSMKSWGEGQRGGNFTIGGGGGDESVRRGAGFQWFVAARPLCPLQCPVAYLSCLQRIQPAGHLEFPPKGAPRLLCPPALGL